MIIPTQQELSKKNAFADKAERIAEAGTLQKQKNSLSQITQKRKNPFANGVRGDEGYIVDEDGALQKRKNGEGSLARFRMAGCGSAFFLFSKKKECKLPRKKKGDTRSLRLNEAADKSLPEQSPVDSSSRALFFPERKAFAEKKANNGRTNLDPRSKFFSFVKRKPCKRETNSQKETSYKKQERETNSQEKTVLQLIKLLSQKALTQKQLSEQLGVTTRAIRYVLSNLLERGIILQRASLLDARQSYYEVIKC